MRTNKRTKGGKYRQTQQNENTKKVKTLTRLEEIKQELWVKEGRLKIYRNRTK